MFILELCCFILINQVAGPYMGTRQCSSSCLKDGATLHTSNASLDFLQGVFGDRLMTGRRRGRMEDWPANSPDLSPADFWLHGYLKVASIEY